MKPDTDAIREWEAMTHTSGFSGHTPSVRACRYVLGLCDKVDALAEENKRLREELEYAIDGMICPLCVMVNPQHKNCHRCADVDSMRAALKLDTEEE